MPDSNRVRIPSAICDELFCAHLFLLCADSNIRWPVSSRISATDSTILRGAGVYSYVPGGVARALYRLSEHRGEYVRLDWDSVPGAGDLFGDGSGRFGKAPRPQEGVESLVRSLPWRVSRSFAFKQTPHVNLQETRAIRAELKHLASSGAGPSVGLPGRCRRRC